MQEAKQNKLALLQQMIDNAERNIVAAKQIMKELNSDNRKVPRESEASQIVEGTFDGEKMISMEGKIYPVPANYASKSKLVEGDLLKLTITEDGSFVYKKISSVDTRKMIGTVLKDGKDKYYVNAEGRRYNVLLASLTYFKAKEGDEVILVVPKEKVSTWAAVESIISEEDRAEMLAQEAERTEIPGQQNMFASQQEAAAVSEAHADNPVALEEKQRNAAIEEEWTPDVEAIKKEGTLGKPAADSISDDFSN
jgi:hypothetical protein